MFGVRLHGKEIVNFYLGTKTRLWLTYLKNPYMALLVSM